MHKDFVSKEWSKELRRIESKKLWQVCADWNRFNKLNFTNLCLPLPNSYISRAMNFQSWPFGYCFEYFSSLSLSPVCSMHIDKSIWKQYAILIPIQWFMVWFCFVFMKAKRMETSSRVPSCWIQCGTDSMLDANKGQKNGNRINCIDTHGEVKFVMHMHIADSS